MIPGLFERIFYSGFEIGEQHVAKNIKNLKTFLNYSTDREYNKTLIYKKFDDSERQTEIYTLTVNELMKIFSHRFQEDRLEKVKDVFCFSCFTGLRFSDVVGLKRDNIFESDIRITIKKTQETTRIPLNQYALSILSKYASDENPLPVISSQRTNEYLKEIGKELQINEPVRIIRYIGNEILQRVVQVVNTNNDYNAKCIENNKKENNYISHGYESLKSDIQNRINELNIFFEKINSGLEEIKFNIQISTERKNTKEARFFLNFLYYLQ